MGRPKKSDTCDHCGEPAYSRHETTPEFWSMSGAKIHPLKNSDGVMCIDCRWTNFSDFCHSQGVSPYNPVKEV